MSVSSTTAEDAIWTQTFVTVTPQEDGFIREIEENVVVSGVADTPLHLDPGNVVMRRSLMSTAKNFINPAELEPLKRIAAECQTYLQGVPKVEFLLVHKDVATQTLYMRSDGQRTATVRSFGDMIAVMNEKPLPELKTTRIVQTLITLEPERFSYDDLTARLQPEVDQAKSDDPDLVFRGAEDENTGMEAADILNFVIDRTMWMSEPEPAAKKEKKDVEAQTHIKFNNITNKITMDHEVQTSLSCEPRHSNTMLLFEYREAKSCCQFQLEECLAKGVYPRIMIDDMLEKIMGRCHDQINFPCQEEAAMNLAEVAKMKMIFEPKEAACLVRKCPARCLGKVCPKLSPKTRRTEDILLADNPSYVVRTPSSAEADPSLKRACSPLVEVCTPMSEKSSLQDSSSSHGDEEMSSESRRTLTTRDEEALELLKSAFCHIGTCNKR